MFSILCRQGFALNFIFINFDAFGFELVLQNDFSHSTILNGVDCEKRVLPSVGFEPTFYL